MGGKTEAARGAGDQVRRHSASAQEGKELCRAGEIAARQQPHTQPHALSAHGPIARGGVEVKDQQDHASGAGAGGEDSRAAQGELVVRYVLAKASTPVWR